MHHSASVHRIQYICQRDVHRIVQRSSLGSPCIFKVFRVHVDYYDRTALVFWRKWSLAGNAGGGADGACIVRGDAAEI